MRRDAWMVLALYSLLWRFASPSDVEDIEEDLKARAKRQVNSLPLVYPYGATYKLLIGIASPVHNDDNIHLAFGVNFQYQYLQFQNITQLSQYYVVNEVSREQREADVSNRKDERSVFYRAVAEVLKFKGLNGKECVLRAICEAAQYPVEDEGFVGELIHILLTLHDVRDTEKDIEYFYPRIPAGSPKLTRMKPQENSYFGPDYGRSPFDEPDPDWEESMAEYVDAATAGRQMFSCSYIYGGCPEEQGIMALFSQLRDE